MAGDVGGGPVQRGTPAGTSLRGAHVRRKPALDGDELIAMGMAPGPLLGETLRRLRSERLEGRISTRDEEIAVVRRAIGGAEGSGKR